MSLLDVHCSHHVLQHATFWLVLGLVSGLVSSNNKQVYWVVLGWVFCVAHTSEDSLQEHWLKHVVFQSVMWQALGQLHVDRSIEGVVELTCGVYGELLQEQLFEAIDSASCACEFFLEKEKSRWFLRKKESWIVIKEVGNRALTSSRPYKQTHHAVC